MSADWTSGYVTNLGYTHGFYRELTPAILRFAALAQGFETSLEAGPITYCELGCGQGFSTNLLAAGNPDLEIYATDFNPEQIAGAQRLAKAAGTTNVHFYDNSFAEFEVRTDLPQFNVIALHGIYSWIAQEHRETIVRFIDARLKPGGLVYISYNCLPGWSNAAPLRQLMRMGAMQTAGAVPAKIDAGLALIEGLQGVGARYFKTVPGVKERMERMKGMSRNYLAHEYLNADWTLFYHSDVAAELSKARLSYIGSAALLDHVDSVNLTAEQQAFLEKVADVTARETVRDYIVNQQFRRDIFARGAVRLSVAESREKWLGARFALTTPADEISLKVKGALGEASLQGEVYQPLIEVFAENSAIISLREAVQHKKVASLGWARLQQAIKVLVGAGHMQPCLAEGISDVKRKKSARAFNTAVMEASRYSPNLQYLASSAFGGAIPVDRFQQLFLLALHKKEADPVQFTWKFLKEQNQKLIKDGKALQSDEENIEQLKIMFSSFDKRTDILKKVGIL